MTERDEERQIIAQDFMDMIRRLTDYYETPEEIVKWFESPQPLLENRTPVALIAEGRAVDLHRVWDSIDAGAYI